MITKQNKKNYVNYTALLIKCLHNYVCAFWISSECCWFWPRHPRRHAPNCVNHLPTKFGISPLPMNLLLRESAINSTQSTAVKHNTNTHRQLVKQSTSTIAQSLRWADTQRDIPNDRVCAPRRDTILYVCVTDHLLHRNNFRSQSENSTIYININCMTMLIRKRLYNSACSWYITTEKKNNLIRFARTKRYAAANQRHTHTQIRDDRNFKWFCCCGYCCYSCQWNRISDMKWRTTWFDSRNMLTRTIFVFRFVSRCVLASSKHLVAK